MIKKSANIAQVRRSFELLGLPLEADVQEIDARWRELRTQLHPDKPTGDAEKFDQTRKAYDDARFHALQPKPCEDCEGTGKRLVKSQNPLQAPLPMTCRTCRGSGQR